MGVRRPESRSDVMPTAEQGASAEPVQVGSRSHSLLLSPLMFQGEKNKYSVPLASFIPQSAVNRRIYQETREDEQ